MSTTQQVLGTPDGGVAPGFWVTTIHGEVDLVNADELCRALLDLARRVPYRAIVDCAGVRFIDVAGCRGLIAAAERAAASGGALRFVAPDGSPLYRLLDLIDLGRRVAVYATVEQAAAGVGRERRDEDGGAAGE